MWYKFCQKVIDQAYKLPDGSVVIPKIVAENIDNEFFLKKLTSDTKYADIKQPLKPSTTQTNSPAPPPSATRSMPPAMPAQTNPATSNTQQKNPNPTTNLNTQQTNQKTLPQRGGNETYISTAPNKYKLNGYDVRIEDGKVFYKDPKTGTEIQSQVSWMPGTSNLQILRDMKARLKSYLIPKPEPKRQPLPFETETSDVRI